MVKMADNSTTFQQNTTCVVLMFSSPPSTIICQKCVVIITNSDWNLNIIHKHLQSVSFLPHFTSPFNLKNK